MQQAIIFGAGSVGRGFIGQLFAESGYPVLFVDIDAPLIAAMNEREGYTITLVENERRDDVVVHPVSGLLSSESNAVVDALAHAALGATAVGARALPHIAPLIARAVERRMTADNDAPLNLIVCENLPDAASHLRSLIGEHLDADGQAYLDSHIGLVNAVIGRMVPEATCEMRAQDVTGIVTEPYKELPVDRAGFVGGIPEIVGLEPREPFAPYIARKLYLHNAAHAVMGYLGYQRHYAVAADTLEDAAIRPIVQGALDEALQGLVARYGMDEVALREHVNGLWPRLTNRPLADPVLRLTRDPLRKLAPEDRLVGAARTAQAAGIVPENLAWGIAGALAYDAPEDPVATALQKRIEEEGVDAVLQTVCDIAPDEPLGVLVLDRYAELRQGSMES